MAEDYITMMSQDKRFPNVTVLGIAQLGMIQAELEEFSWETVVMEELGKERMDKLAKKAWQQMGYTAYPLVQAMFGVAPEPPSWDFYKKVVKLIYQAFIIPIEITKDDDSVLEFNIVGCPYNGYKEYTGMKENDYCCNNLREVHPPWLYGMAVAGKVEKEVPLENIVMDSALCCGDKNCHVVIKRKK